MIEQLELGPDTISFVHALEHVLRQDPDVIMIVEMRASSRFIAAMSAADTGHLVLSTVHTTNASQSVICDGESSDDARAHIGGSLP